MGRSVLWVLAVLFSLSPCPVKETVLGIAGQEYNSPLNKAKATANPVNNCGEFNASVDREAAVSKQDFKSIENEFQESFAWNNCDGWYHSKFRYTYSEHTARKALPKYILFKRLKIHLV